MNVRFLTNKDEKNFVKTVNGKSPDVNGNVVVQGGGGGTGESSADGFSPIANVTQTDSGAVISITDKNGTTTATIVNGKDGADGAPGEKGEKGEPGKDGANGKDGTNGKDGVSATHSWNGTTLTITSASGTSSADLKGDKGDQGIQGIQGEPGEKGATGDKGDKGDTGATGVSVSSVKQTTTSSADGGSNVVTVTLSNGTTSTFTVKNGSKGSSGTNGTNGKTPVKGVDYWTAADQEAIVQQVIAALGTPVFGRVDADNNIILTGELADGTYTIKYEDAEGNLTEIGTLIQAPDAPNYTNQIPISTDTDGSVFNGTGYQTAKRISGSAGTLSDIANPNVATPAFVTGFIPVKNGDVIRLKNCWMDTASLDDSKSPYGHRTWALSIVFYDSGKARRVSDAWSQDGEYNYITPVIEADGKIYKFTVNYSGAVFMRINLAANDPAEAILTVNEEII